MSNWKLPWHYLATGPCLLDDPGKVEAYLESDNLDYVLDPDQTVKGGGPPPLISKITEIGQAHKRNPRATAESRQFTWSNAQWPIDLKLFIRNFSRLDKRYGFEKYGGFVLTHDVLYLRGDRAGIDCPPLTEEEFNGLEALFSESFMDAFDDLVTDRHKRREAVKPERSTVKKSGKGGHSETEEERDELRSDEAIKRIILESLKHRSGVPESLEVKMMDNSQTTETLFECSDGHFVLHLGWRRDFDAEASDYDLHSVSPLDHIAPFIAKFPCGPLELE